MAAVSDDSGHPVVMFFHFLHQSQVSACFQAWRFRVLGTHSPPGKTAYSLNQFLNCVTQQTDDPFSSTGLVEGARMPCRMWFITNSHLNFFLCLTTCPLFSHELSFSNTSSFSLKPPDFVRRLRRYLKFMTIGKQLFPPKVKLNNHKVM